MVKRVPPPPLALAELGRRAVGADVEEVEVVIGTAEIAGAVVTLLRVLDDRAGLIAPKSSIRLVAPYPRSFAMEGWAVDDDPPGRVLNAPAVEGLRVCP